MSKPKRKAVLVVQQYVAIPRRDGLPRSVWVMYDVSRRGTVTIATVATEHCPAPWCEYPQLPTIPTTIAMFKEFAQYDEDAKDESQ